ncbi:MAG: endoribonuclease MazF [Brevinematales bacterium]|nr:endoribonuclease MazF [Brevinematales bacterium]
MGKPIPEDKLAAKSGSYIPDRGDIVWLMFNPRSGHEQSGHRPALVISPKAYNAKTGLALFCPITTKIKGYPFEIRVNAGDKINGAVLCDQVKSLDWRARDARFITAAPGDIIAGVIGFINLLINE